MKSSFKSVAFFKQLIIFFLSKAQKGENTKKKKHKLLLYLALNFISVPYLFT